MFTGLVEQLAEIVGVDALSPGQKFTLEVGPMAGETNIGDSVALNGCCLTVVQIDGTRLAFEAGPETLNRSNLGDLSPGSFVNVERALQLGDRLGGHMVSGHIDATGTLVERVEDGEWSTCWFEVPKELTRQMASKGSIAIDGVSLTLVDVTEARFSVMLIPHTLEVTTLGKLTPGARVNLETDVLAKYVQRQLEYRG